MLVLQVTTGRRLHELSFTSTPHCINLTACCRAARKAIPPNTSPSAHDTNLLATSPLRHPQRYRAAHPSPTQQSRARHHSKSATTTQQSSRHSLLSRLSLTEDCRQHTSDLKASTHCNEQDVLSTTREARTRDSQSDLRVCLDFRHRAQARPKDVALHRQALPAHRL
jgi:hypothetical protein